MELYISDLDGTLLDNDARLSGQTLAVINGLIDKGLSFTVATARTIASAGRILEGLHLRLPMILMNGVLIFDPVKSTYVKVNSLTKETAAGVIDISKELGLSCFMYLLNSRGQMETVYERIGSEAMEGFCQQRKQRYYKSFRQENDLKAVEGEKIYFTFIDSPERLRPLRDKVKALDNVCFTYYNDVYSPGTWYLEVFSHEASKAEGVRWLKENCGFERVTAFGDNTNDLPLFEAADRKIAVANAVRELRDAADTVIESNLDNGVAGYLEKAWRKENS